MPVPAGSTPVVIELAEFKRQLQIPETSTRDDVELTLHLQAAIEAVEERVGPLCTRTVSERVEARNGRICLQVRPVVSVESVTEVAGSVTWAEVEYDVDHAAGILSGAVGRRFPRCRFDVTYRAGHGDTVPDKLKLATLYVAEHLWEMQQRGPSSGRPGLDLDTPTDLRVIPRSFALPRRALELLAGDDEIAIG